MKKQISTDHEYVLHACRPNKRGISSPFNAFVSIRYTLNRQLLVQRQTSLDENPSAICKPADRTTCTLFIAGENNTPMDSIAGLARSIIFFNWKNNA